MDRRGVLDVADKCHTKAVVANLHGMYHRVELETLDERTDIFGTRAEAAKVASHHPKKKKEQAESRGRRIPPKRQHDEEV